ncbi:dihydropteroate synthase [Roseimaritima sediminicola]|uniref:dihydropteroate synthase n=1 Tax=Roseimaritima sediminicola TaxID=2662066 RepID=UPI00192A4945|nr:dihydropteroate synthase [Roseimaritima sediminicola]
MTTLETSPQNFPGPNLWRLRTRTLTLGQRPLVMGILNVTPDSFSDGGRHLAEDAAVEAALRMEDEGADIIDVGGESTRPYSDPVAAEAERARVVPVLERLAGRLSAAVSIDTSKALVAEAAVECGAEIINDVTGLTGDAAMTEVAVRTAAGVCVMHMQGTPQTMQDDPRYDDVTDDIVRYLLERAEACLAAGIQRNRICLDPGIGFGKTHQHNLTLLRDAARFTRLGWPILVGHSRKGFVGHVLGDKQRDRDAGTLGASLALARSGVHVLRVHNVAQTVDALKLFEAAGGFQ